MTAAFATAADVAARWRPLSTQEAATADVLCADASNILRAQFPGIDQQIGSQLDAAVVTQVVAGMAKRAMVGPEDGVASQSDTAGPFSRSRSFANPLGNVYLTEPERLLILGYQPPGQSFTFANTTCRREGGGPGYVYGWPS